MTTERSVWSTPRKYVKSLPFILPLVDPKVNQSRAVAFACVHNQTEMFDMLYPLSDPRAALATIREGWGNDKATLLLERLKIDETKDLLETSLTQVLGGAQKKRPRAM